MWVAVCILGIFEKRRKISKLVYQSLRNVVKEGGPDVIHKFKQKFKEIRIEGNRKAVSSTMFSEKLLSTLYTEAEPEAMYMGTESQARKRFQRNNSFNRKRQSFYGRQRSLFQGLQYGSGRYAPWSRYDGYKSGERGDLSQHNQSQT